jgi:hypothetical protein
VADDDLTGVARGSVTLLDVLGVIALICPNCAARSALVLNYGPVATVEDAAALLGLDRPTENVG